MFPRAMNICIASGDPIDGMKEIVVSDSADLTERLSDTVLTENASLTETFHMADLLNTSVEKNR